MYVIAFPVLYFIVRGMLSVARTKRTMKVSEFLMLLLVGEAFMYVGNVVGTSLNGIFGAFMGGEIENSTSELIESSPIWVILIVAVILGPIVEELIFRKLMMDKFGIYGDRMAIVVSAIAFGIFHGNFYQLFYATLLGLVLGYIYAKTSNILYPILLHMIINLWGSLVPMLMMDHIVNVEKFYNEYFDAMLEGGELAANLDIAPYYVSVLLFGLYSMIQMGMVVAGLIIFFKKRKKIFVSDRCEVTIPKHRRAGVIMGNVGAILFMVISGLTMLLNIISPILERIAATAGQV
jgi:membrane protease YdiL (CAAX protease family)